MVASSIGLTFQSRRLRCCQSCSACTTDHICAIKLHMRHSRCWCRSRSLPRAPSCCDMVSSVDRLAGAAAVGSSGAAAASRSCVGGGTRGLGGAGPRLYAGRAGKPAAGHRARLTTLGICCIAPKSRSKATIRVKMRKSQSEHFSTAVPLKPDIGWRGWHVRKVPILLQESFCTGDQKFSGP
jgi:hypothetical protein